MDSCGPAGIVRHQLESATPQLSRAWLLQIFPVGKPNTSACCLLIQTKKLITSTIHFCYKTVLKPEQFVAGLTDFGPDRSKLFGNSADEYPEVHRRDPFEADVTEGSGGIWERLHYDWSDPDCVVMKTTDSNVWGGRAIPTHLRVCPTGRLRWTRSLFAKARASRDGCSGSCSEPSSDTFWKKSLQTVSRPLKPGTVRQEKNARLVPANPHVQAATWTIRRTAQVFAGSRRCCGRDPGATDR